MLTREQLHVECRKIFDALPDRGETIDGIDDAVLKLNKQAAKAIDLQLKLDKIRTLLAPYDVVDRMATTILSVLDEKGE